jgi:hypothetical protein
MKKPSAAVQARIFRLQLKVVYELAVDMYRSGFYGKDRVVVESLNAVRDVFALEEPDVQC